MNINDLTDNVAPQDRNFDPISEHFAKKVYGGLKGQIRLHILKSDIQDAIKDLDTKKPLKILDVGAGLAQISLDLAKDHQVTINDISVNMLDKARQDAQNQAIDIGKVRFIACPYQELPKHLGDEKFDLILCHALLEWLGQPKQIMDFFNQYLKPSGLLSLCFYNPASLIYRNLIMGNFYQLDKPKPADNKSLTPNHPVSPDDVEDWLKAHNYDIKIQSGIRVFWDYTPLKRGGLENPDHVIMMEKRYSRQLPFRLMGRYLHIIASAPKGLQPTHQS